MIDKNWASRLAIRERITVGWAEFHEIHHEVSKMQWSHFAAVSLAFAIAVLACRAFAASPANYVAGELVTLNDNSAWSWFMDERAIVHDGSLIVGSMRSVGDFHGGQGDPNWGNVELAVYDIDRGDVHRVVLDPHFEQDDHDNPALLALPDGRILAVYTRHATERKVFCRISAPHDPLTWGPVQTVVTPGKDSPPYSGDNVTYSNVFRLKSGRIYNFYRGFDYDPNYMFSDDDGRTWRLGGRLVKGLDGYGPYAKYAFDGDRTIHFVATEDHPRLYDNNLYHGIIRDGSVLHSDGTRMGPLSDSPETRVSVANMTNIFSGDPDNTAWMTDLELDDQQRPVVLFSVQKDGRGLGRKQGGFDHRFHFARWDGAAWQQHEIAYAGERLYPGEDDYTGLAAIDPHYTNVVYISTDAKPETGTPLVSEADGKRHHELFRGETADGGISWNWTPITANSTMDNLRPIVPKWDDERTALVWMRGDYHSNHGQWTTAVVALIRPDSGSANN